MASSWRTVPCFLLLIPFVAACRSAPPAAAVVEFWALGREGEVVERMVPAFERRHPSIRVRLQRIPWSAAHEKLLTAYVASGMPDVFQLGNTWVPEFVTLGAVEPLDRLLDRPQGLLRADYFPGILDTNVIDGAAYAVPWYVDTRLLFYRTDLLAAAGYPDPPRTWSQWVDAMGRLRARAAPGEFPLLLPLSEWQPLVVLAMQLDAELLRERDTLGNFTTAPFRRALTFYLELFRSGLAPLATNAAVANLYQDFARGTFAFYLSGPWNIGEFKARLPSSMRGRWSTAPLPAPDGGSYPGVSLAGGASLGVSRGSARKEAAWALIEFLSEPAQQLELYRLTGDLPSRMSAWTSGGPADDPLARAFWVQLHNVRPTPKIPEWERIAAEISRAADAVVRARMTIDEALPALDRQVADVLEKRRWMMRRSAP
jgi:multiple sugar transport system substrate-binding protein